MSVNPIERIESYRSEYTRNDHQIADFITSHPHDVVTSTLEDLANKSSLSPSAFVRFSKKIGYEGYSALKFDLSRYLVSRNASSHNNDVSPIQAITSAYSNYILDIANMITMEQTREIADMIIKANRIMIVGFNRSRHSAMQLKRRLSRLGIDSQAPIDHSDIEDAASICGKDDLFIIFSISNQGRYDNEVKEMVHRGTPVICITMSRVISFASMCTELVILPRIDKETSEYYLDNQTIFFVYIEVLLNVLASQWKQELPTQSYPSTHE